MKKYNFLIGLTLLIVSIILSNTEVSQVNKYQLACL